MFFDLDMGKFAEYKCLAEDFKLNNKSIAKHLNISIRQCQKYAKALKEQNIAVVQDYDFQTKTIFNDTYIITKWKQCLNLTENGIKSIQVKGDKEIIKYKDEEKELPTEIDIVSDGRIKGKRVLVLEVKFKYFYKTLTLAQKNNLTPNKSIYTVYTGERLDTILYDTIYYTCRRSSFTGLGAVEKVPYELRRFANAKHTSSYDRNNLRWIVYDIEALANKDRVMTPYLICAIEFDPETKEIFDSKTFKCDNLMDTLQETNPVVEKFREYVFSIIERKADLFRENGSYSNTMIFGYNNYRFDDMLVNPAFQNYIQKAYDKENVNLKQDKFVQTIITRNGAIISSTLRLNCELEDRKLYGASKVEFKDIVKWIPDKSLAEACKDFEIGKDSKIDFDILKYNEDCIKNNYNHLEWEDFEIVCSSFIKSKKKKKGLQQEDKDKLKSKPYYKDGKIHLWEMCQDYCMFDCISTKEISIKLYDIVKDISKEFCESQGITIRSYNMFNYHSPATIAYHFMERYFGYKKTTLRLVVNHAELGRRIHKSYFGGRTDFSMIGKYKTVGGKLRYYDVTSEYPLAMMKKYPVLEEEHDLKCGFEIDHVYYQKILDDIYEKRKTSGVYDDFTIFRPLDDEFNGIFQCNLYPPEDTTQLITFAPMATRREGEVLQYENVTRKNVTVNTAFLKNYLMTGYRIEIIPDSYNIVFTNLQYIFKEYIEYFGGQKTSAKEVDENKSKAKLFKLIINAIAGKLAQKPGANISTSHTEAEIDVDQSKFEDWTKSNHYLATFIIAEANFILYSTLYRLQLTNIYNKVPQSERTGALLYMDTDSIIFDADLCDTLEWDFQEKIGDWNENTNYFNNTWKAKYTKKSPDTLIVLGKKSYFICKGDEFIDTKLKGIHKGQMTSFIESIDSILDGVPKVSKFEGLIRKPIKLQSGQNDINKSIHVGSIQKTLRAVNINKVFSIESTNKTVIENNKDNNLFFCLSKYETK
jgi:hypothetical protein